MLRWDPSGMWGLLVLQESEVRTSVRVEVRVIIGVLSGDVTLVRCN